MMWPVDLPASLLPRGAGLTFLQVQGHFAECLNQSNPSINHLQRQGFDEYDCMVTTFLCFFLSRFEKENCPPLHLAPCSDDDFSSFFC